MRIAAACLAFLCCAGWTRAGFGAGPERALGVERGPGAEGCPDEDDLARRVEALRGRPASGERRYRITFARHDATLSAAIRMGDDAANVRVLETREATCDGLAQATAVTLSLLMDSEVTTVSPPDGSGPVSRADDEPRPATRRERVETAGTLALGGAALFGVVRPVAPLVTLELGMRVGAFRASIGALVMIPQELELGPGSVHERLAAGTARLCLSPLGFGSLRLDLCSGAWLGQRRAEGRGYTDDIESKTTWLGIPLELSLADLSSPFGWEVSVMALLSFPRRDYTVSGVGTAYESWPIGAVLSVRGHGVVSW
ncbi:MAG TPA: hypothetical protein VF103_09050 [Polyangiaceae bacterium]